MLNDVSIWITLVTAALLWIPQNAAHEAAHCLAHKAAGDIITSFWPFPGRKLGYFTFAHMTYKNNPEKVSPFMDGVCACAPQLANTLVLVLLAPLHTLAVPTWMASILVGWGVVNFVDGATNLGTFYRSAPKPSTDGWRTARAWGFGPWTGRLVAALWHVGMGLHVAWLT